MQLHPDTVTARCCTCKRLCPTFGEPGEQAEPWQCFECFCKWPLISSLRTNAEVREILLSRMRTEGRTLEEAVEEVA